MKKLGTKGFTLIVALLVIAGLGYYIHLNNKSTNRREISKKTEKDILLDYDFQNDYPKTVRETVKLHCRYLKSAYSGEFTEDELFTVNQQIRNLFDDELLEFNTAEVQLQNLKDEIKLYEDSKWKFVSYSLAEASQVENNTEGGKEYAKIKVTIVLNMEASRVSTDEEYILRKDGEGNWKIMGWQVVKNKEAENEGEAK